MVRHRIIRRGELSKSTKACQDGFARTSALPAWTQRGLSSPQQLRTVNWKRSNAVVVRKLLRTGKSALRWQ